MNVLDNEDIVISVKNIDTSAVCESIDMDLQSSFDRCGDKVSDIGDSIQIKDIEVHEEVSLGESIDVILFSDDANVLKTTTIVKINNDVISEGNVDYDFRSNGFEDPSPSEEEESCVDQPNVALPSMVILNSLCIVDNYIFCSFGGYEVYHCELRRLTCS